MSISQLIPPDILETDLVLDACRADFALTGLKVSSTLRLHRLMTVTTFLIRCELGELSSSMKEEVDKRLRNLFEL
jgi:mRNA interferase MazF